MAGLSWDPALSALDMSDMLRPNDAAVNLPGRLVDDFGESGASQ